MTNEEIKILLEQVYERSEEKFKNVFTPFEITKQMFNSLKYDETKTLLVIVNLEFLIELKKRNYKLDNVFYSTGCNYKKQVAIQLGINVNNIFHLEYNKEINVTNDMAMKFDYMVGNPPYNPNSLWKKFVLWGIDHLTEEGKMVFIHPDTWRTSTMQKSFYNEHKQHLSELHVLGYNVFKNAEVSVDWYVYNKQKQNNTYVHYNDNIDFIKTNEEISMVSKKSIEYSIMSKICTIEDNGLFIKNTGYVDMYKDHVDTGKYRQCGGYKRGTAWTRGDFTLLNKPTDHQFINKIVMSYCGKPRAQYFNDNTGVLSGFYWLTDNQSLPILLNSKMMWKILLIFSGEKFKYKGLQNPSSKILRSINFENLNVKSEEELYEHYGLTQEEIDWIESDEY